MTYVIAIIALALLPALMLALLGALDSIEQADLDDDLESRNGPPPTHEMDL